MSLKDTSVVGIAAADLKRRHPEVPDAVMPNLVARTILGIIFGTVGLGLIALLVAVPVALAWIAKDASKISLPLVGLGLIVGLGMIVLGAVTAAGRLVTSPLATTVAIGKGIYRAVRNKGNQSGSVLLPVVAGLAVVGSAAVVLVQGPTSAAGEFSLGVTIGILLGEALAMLGAPYIIKKFGMSFGAFTSEAQRENTAAMLELTKLLKATGHTATLRAVDEQRKEVA